MGNSVQLRRLVQARKRTFSFFAVKEALHPTERVLCSSFVKVLAPTSSSRCSLRAAPHKVTLVVLLHSRCCFTGKMMDYLATTALAHSLLTTVWSSSASAFCFAESARVFCAIFGPLFSEAEPHSSNTLKKIVSRGAEQLDTHGAAPTRRKGPLEMEKCAFTIGMLRLLPNAHKPPSKPHPFQSIVSAGFSINIIISLANLARTWPHRHWHRPSPAHPHPLHPTTRGSPSHLNSSRRSSQPRSSPSM